MDPQGELLEREGALEELTALFAEAASARGRLALVSGDAGAGKTAVVHRFCADSNTSGLLLVGACDPLTTPRALGPLVDIASSVGGQLEHLLREGASADRVVGEFLLIVTRTVRPLIVVLEDVHWADQATLDLLCVLGRRLGKSRALVIATYRDDGLPVGHPLRLVLGELATCDAVRHVSVGPLSAAAVRHLARGRSADPATVHRLSGGNAFFVTEILASGASELPLTVRDAVLARAHRLPVGARRVLQAVSAFGASIGSSRLTRVDPELLAEVEPSDAALLDDCVASGLLCWEGQTLAFRHELARAAVETSISPPRRADLHRRILAVLRARPVTADDFATLAWHAEEGGDSASVLELATAAAQRAQALSAHREAAAQYARAARHARIAPLDRQAMLLEAWSHEAFLCGDIADAVEAGERALGLRRELSQRGEEGSDLRHLALLLSNTDRRAEAVPIAHAAIDVLEALEAPEELAAAYATLGGLHAQAADNAEAMMWSEKAMDLAREHGLVGVRVSALRTIASAKLCGPLEDGWLALDESLELSLAANRVSDVADTYLMMLWFGAFHRNFAVYDRYASISQEYCNEHDLVLTQRRIQATRAVELLHRGHWSEAGDVAESIVRLPYVVAVDRIEPLYALGRLRARRGDPDAWPLLDEALALALPREAVRHLGNARAARAEAAWCGGSPVRAASEAAEAYDLALRSQDPWIVGELAYWMWRGGKLDASLPSVIASHPYGLQIRGDWQRAAAEWERIGCPFETATALMDSDDEAVLRRALQILEGLGARPVAAMVARRLRALGVRAVPRRPHASTRANPHGLTDRQMEVLALVAEGMTDAEIAARLFLTPKTVQHHVGALLAKLGVRSRLEAARRMTWASATEKSGQSSR